MRGRVRGAVRRPRANGCALFRELRRLPAAPNCCAANADGHYLTLDRWRDARRTTLHSCSTSIRVTRRSMRRATRLTLSERHVGTFIAPDDRLDRSLLVSTTAVGAADHAAALALRAPALVRAQMPVLRFQLARGSRRAAVRRLRRRAAGRPRPRPAAGLGPHRADGVLRRRHAEPVSARIHRPLPAGRQQPPALRARLRDHAGNQPGHRRTRPLRAVPQRRREPAQLRHPELRRRLPAAAGPHPRQRRGAKPR